LRRFAHVGGDPVPYDFNGVVRLSQHASEAGLEEVGGSFRNAQGAFFLKPADHVRRSTAA